MLAVDRSFVLPAQLLTTVVVVPVAENNRWLGDPPGPLSDTSRSCRYVCEALKFTETVLTVPVCPATVNVTSLNVVDAF